MPDLSDPIPLSRAARAGLAFIAFAGMLILVGATLAAIREHDARLLGFSFLGLILLVLTGGSSATGRLKIPKFSRRSNVILGAVMAVLAVGTLVSAVQSGAWREFALTVFFAFSAFGSLRDAARTNARPE